MGMGLDMGVGQVASTRVATPRGWRHKGQWGKCCKLVMGLGKELGLGREWGLGKAMEVGREWELGKETIQDKKMVQNMEPLKSNNKNKLDWSIRMLD